MTVRLKIVYETVPVEKVVRYFTDSYSPVPQAMEWYHDPTKGVFVFKLYLKEQPADASRSIHPTTRD